MRHLESVTTAPKVYLAYASTPIMIVSHHKSMSAVRDYDLYDNRWDNMAISIC